MTVVHVELIYRPVRNLSEMNTKKSQSAQHGRCTGEFSENASARARSCRVLPYSSDWEEISAHPAGEHKPHTGHRSTHIIISGICSMKPMTFPLDENLSHIFARCIPPEVSSGFLRGSPVPSISSHLVSLNSHLIVKATF